MAADRGGGSAEPKHTLEKFKPLYRSTFGPSHAACISPVHALPHPKLHAGGRRPLRVTVWRCGAGAGQQAKTGGGCNAKIGTQPRFSFGTATAHVVPRDVRVFLSKEHAKTSNLCSTTMGMPYRILNPDMGLVTGDGA